MDSRNAILYAFKLSGCAECSARPLEGGGDRPMTDFQCHHRDPITKDRVVSHNLLRGSIAVMLDELKKCDVLCSECHKKRHNDNGFIPGQETLFEPSGYEFRPFRRAIQPVLWE